MSDDLQTMLAELAGPPTVIEPAAVKARARELETRRRHRFTLGAVAAATVLVVGGVVAWRLPAGPDRRVDVTDTTQGPPATVFPSGWRDLAHLNSDAMTVANTMQDDARSLLWTGSLVVIPGLREALTFDPATNTFGALPPAPIDLSSTRGSYRGTLPWIWTGTEILRIDPTPLPADASGGSALGPLVGQAFSPATNTWRTMAPAPVEHLNGIAWADTQLLAWSRNGIHAYHPATDTWELLTDQSGPASDAGAENGSWTRTELVLVGRTAAAAFDPGARTWRTLPAPPAASDRTGTTAPMTSNPGVIRVQWTGSEVLAYDATTGTIHRLDVAAGTWRSSPSNGMVGRQSTRSALWAGDRFVVWGGPVYAPDGQDGSRGSNARDGAAWDPTTNTWQPIADIPEGAIPMNAVLAGQRFIALFQAGNTSTHDERMLVLQLHP